MMTDQTPTQPINKPTMGMSLFMEKHVDEYIKYTGQPSPDEEPAVLIDMTIALIDRLHRSDRYFQLGYLAMSILTEEQWYEAFGIDELKTEWEIIRDLNEEGEN